MLGHVDVALLPVFRGRDKLGSLVAERRGGVELHEPHRPAVAVPVVIVVAGAGTCCWFSGCRRVGVEFREQWRWVVVVVVVVVLSAGLSIISEMGISEMGIKYHQVVMSIAFGMLEAIGCYTGRDVHIQYESSIWCH